MAERPLPVIRCLFAGEHPHQRRLARAVGAEERDAIAALDVQAQIPEHHQVAVRLSRVLQLDHRAPALRAGGKVEMDFLALGGHFDRNDLLELLDPALHLRRLGRLIAEPIDEHLDARNLLVLLALCLAERLEARLVLHEIVAVVADVVGERAQREIRNPGDDGVEKEPVVADEDDRMRIRVQVFLQPVARLEIEMVRRLVEQQQVRLAEQQLRERDAHLPAPGKRLRRTLEVGRLETEALEHRRRLQLDAVALAQPELILQIAVAMEHRVVLGLGDGRVAQPVLERVHLGLDRDELAERARRFREQRAAGVRKAVLRQISDRQRRGLQHGARVGLVEPCHHPQERRLAGAVGAAQADALAIGDLPRDVVEEHAVAERFREVLKLDHVEREPFSVARGSRSKRQRSDADAIRRALSPPPREPAARGTAS